MNTQDHFDSALDVELNEYPNSNRFDHAEHGQQGEPDAYGRFHASQFGDEEPPKLKKTIPTPVLLIGGIVLFMVGAFIFKEITAPKPVSATQFDTESVTAVPASRGGMIPTTPSQAPVELPAQNSMPPAPQGGMPVNSQPTLAQQPQVSPPVAKPLASALPYVQTPDVGAAIPTVPATASNGGDIQTPTVGPDMLNSSVSDPKDAEIAMLKAQLAQMKISDASDTHIRHTRSHPVATRRYETARATPASDTSNGDASANVTPTEAPPSVGTKSAALNKHQAYQSKHHRQEIQLGFHIKQVVPGQGWVQDEESGKQIVVAVGDKIGNAEVTKIDAANFKIYTTAGVIQ